MIRIVGINPEKRWDIKKGSTQHSGTFGTTQVRTRSSPATAARARWRSRAPGRRTPPGTSARRKTRPAPRPRAPASSSNRRRARPASEAPCASPSRPKCVHRRLLLFPFFLPPIPEIMLKKRIHDFLVSLLTPSIASPSYYRGRIIGI